uniref:Potassium channel subfamily K member 1 n=1 Tax=Parastrongyloides trichosuri TaxID=131310 RepID=A0A0N5A459_PARTI
MKIKNIIRIASCHLALYCFVVFYIVGGGYIFHYLEGPAEEDKHVKMKENLIIIKKIFVNKVTFSNSSDFIEECLLKLLRNLSAAQTGHEAHDIQEALSILINENQRVQKRWTLESSILFAFTILTTIGYGNLAPTSKESQIFTMIYGAIGIPLFLITIADLGRFFKTAIFFILQVVFKREIKKTDDQRLLREIGEVILVALLFLGFIATGSAILPLWESDLSYFQSVYFSYMSLTTIGLGDIVPRRMDFLLPTLVYITIGFWLTTALVEQLADVFRLVHYYGRHVSNVKGITVWLGGRRLSVGYLIQTVCRRVGMSDHIVGQINWDKTLDQVLSGQALESIPIFPWHFSDFIERDPPLIDSSLDFDEIESAYYYNVPTICNSPDHNVQIRRGSRSTLRNSSKYSRYSSLLGDECESQDSE